MSDSVQTDGGMGGGGAHLCIDDMSLALVLQSGMVLYEEIGQFFFLTNFKSFHNKKLKSKTDETIKLSQMASRESIGAYSGQILGNLCKNWKHWDGQTRGFWKNK